MPLLNRTTLWMAMLVSVSAVAQPVLKEDWWQGGEGPVAPEYPGIRCSVVDEETNTLYVGGSGYYDALMLFEPHQDMTYGAVVRGDGEGWPALTHDAPNGVVRTVIPDGEGGWFIGGDFTMIGEVGRLKLARLNADGTLDADWGPFASVQGTRVNALAIDGDVLYVGGSFSSAGGAPVLNNLAAFSISTGEVLPWGMGEDMGTDAEVDVIAVGDQAIYIAGDFEMAGGTEREFLAALDLNTGAATAWAPIVTTNVYSITHVENTVYIGGAFSSVNSTSRSRIAALDESTGVLTSWNPGANSIVYVMKVSGDTLFAGGSFETIGGVQRGLVAALDRNSNAVFEWGPKCEGGNVKSMVVTPDRVFVGGQIQTADDATGIGGYRGDLAAFDRASGTLLDWNPYSYHEGAVNAIALAGNNLYIAGGEGEVGSRVRAGVAAFDLSTGRPTRWRERVLDWWTGPGLPETFGFGGNVNAMTLKGDTLFVAGSFTEVDSTTRNRVAALHRTTGALLGWQADVNGTVNAMAIIGGRLYLGGGFTMVNGIPRNRLAAINISTMTVAQQWVADADASVTGLHSDGDELYVIGTFTTINGEAHESLAVLDPNNGAPASFGFDFTGQVRTVQTKGDTVFVGGTFNTINGLQRWGLAALSRSQGTVLADWICDATRQNGQYADDVTTLLLNGDVLYVGGAQELEGEPVDGLGAVSCISGLTLNEWVTNISTPGALTVLQRAGDVLVALGSFTSVGGVARHSLAAWEGMTAYEDLGTFSQSRISNEDVVLVHPNPARETCTLLFPGDLAPTEVVVTDALGRTVARPSIIAGLNRLTLDVHALDPDLYNITVLFKDGTRLVSQFVKI